MGQLHHETHSTHHLKNAIEFRNVTKKYGEVTAINNLNLSIPEGKITVFVGPSGCGKTTSLRMINRMIEPTQGEILVHGEPNHSIRDYQLRRSMGYVLQQAGLMPHRTIVDNIATVPRLNGMRRSLARTKACELMDTVGLDRSLAKRYPSELSGGQAQRVGVARALANDSSILLMDEPFSAVDPVVRKDLQDELLRLQKTLNRTIIFVTHDIDEAILLGDYIAVFSEGELAQVGSPEEILREPANDFVASFIGRDRGMRRLTFASGEGLKVYPLDSLNTPWQRWKLNVEDGKPAGWFIDNRLVAGGSLYREGGNLRDALDSVLSSPSGWGVVIDDEGYVKGLLNSDDVLDATEAERHRRYGVSV
ncbi:ABC transporter ATP-binding protein [Rothia sp. P6271]|uniref:ABC transporter ATP-binding protein n=1 Tax=unclassified Rothia (in: high G+C Gram-positive bacteria) TaxID=2689056 RepID=UPI003AD371CB